MDKSSLYSSFCRLFEKLYPQEDCGQSNSHGTCGRKSWNVGRSHQFDGKTNSKKLGFNQLFSHLSQDTSEPNMHQIYTHLFNLKRENLAAAEAVENLLNRLEEREMIEDVLPVINLLFRINPIGLKKSTDLMVLSPRGNFQTNSPQRWPNSSPKRNVATTTVLPYQMFDTRMFQIPAIKLEESLNSEFGLWKQFDRMDVAHRQLFGVLSNPPKSLSYLGISKRSCLRLSMKNLLLSEETSYPICEDTLTPCTVNKEEEEEENLSKTDVAIHWSCLPDIDEPVKQTWESKINPDFHQRTELPYLTEAPISIMQQVIATNVIVNR